MTVASTFVATSGEGYELQMGRWSRRLAPLLIDFVRIPAMATTLSGAWRPRDPVDDDQDGARACWRRWSYFLISVFEVRVKR